MRTLRDVRIGESAVVKKLYGEGALRRRIMDMGITKGVTVKVRKAAPLGDPLELTVRGNSDVGTYCFLFSEDESGAISKTMAEIPPVTGEAKIVLQ